ncbi:Morn repeat domain containing protein [Pandoravirus salinus]|uniref:Morn repeat domain containing protein n=1 Tax=Pandoravirus salinus TaxID=1349410 RepID=S4VVP1_9VIRU|nr:morn repeat domain [Pandoravirus salinus]AGO84714.2 Morn repeat domain containing protein [Pandoravirus salinus]
MKRPQGATPTSGAVDEAGGLCARRKRRRRDAPVVQMPFSFFDGLPDELVLAIFVVLDDLPALALWSQTSHRHHALANDPLLWRRLCETRFGPLLLHRRFAEAGKDWCWLYRAQSRPAAPVGIDVGAVVVQADAAEHVYWGDCLDGLPHGYGVALPLPTRHCQGSHSLSRVKTGHADASPMIDPGYEGDWRHGHRCGRGVCTSAGGSQYDGEWKNDARHGHGTHTQTDHCYKGEFVDGGAHGYGVCAYADGHIYQGQWWCDQYYGSGVYTWPDGSRYEGEFAYNKSHGHGVHVYASGGVYKGHWQNNRRHGYGVNVFPSGARYIGGHANDQYDGHGIYTWPDGTQYKGDYKRGAKDGKGVLVKPNGTIYDGDWVDNKRHGHGTLIKTDSSRYQGRWQGDDRDGEGTWYYTDGSCVQGEWTHRALVAGTVVRHRTRDTPCCLDAPCRACAVVAAAAAADVVHTDARPVVCETIHE